MGSLDTLSAKYQSLKLYGALYGDFRFEMDYAAYEAYVNGDLETLEKLVNERKAAMGQPKVKFQKGERAKAQKAYVEAQSERKPDLSDAPMHLVKVTKDEALFSNKRPKKVETSFGTEADNSEAL